MYRSRKCFRCRGSPPHARGAANQCTALTDHRGITPACAGSSTFMIFGKEREWDHPRMRGEQEPECICIPSGCGITPACAGSRKAHSRKPARKRDHPRMRGEQCGKFGWHNRSGGSPPHARGAGDCIPPFFLGGGITPACAGSRPTLSDDKAGQRDHPRMRGEQASALSGLFQQVGITPACAGSRSGTGWSRAKVGDHPRMRGEQCPNPMLLWFPLGSPPHARGAVRSTAI